MSALGQKRTLTRIRPMSALPPKADIPERQLDVCFGAISGLMHRSKSTLFDQLIGANEK
jgi:hypothetical protein